MICLSIYLHPELLLPLTGSHIGYELSYGYRHVEFGMYSSRALHWVSHFPGWKWTGAIRFSLREDSFWNWNLSIEMEAQDSIQRPPDVQSSLIPSSAIPSQVQSLSIPSSDIPRLFLIPSAFLAQQFTIQFCSSRPETFGVTSWSGDSCSFIRYPSHHRDHLHLWAI